ncbi:MAG TPA: PQQ-dependent sugar dehydrogenase [Planctomycetota bacterium]|nr:PQQ-dependent sugar dehydrogenase [Planctomycetota bacterium]
MTPIALLVALAAGTTLQQPTAERVPWTTSRLTGSPEPPPPIQAVRVFPSLTFNRPVDLIPFPGAARWALVEEGGVIWSFRNDPSCLKADPFLDLRKEIRNLGQIDGCQGVASSYSLVFDPDFSNNRFCYVMYLLASKGGHGPLENGCRVSRFRATDVDPPRLDPESEEVLVSWVVGGHNGCDLHFGNDGYLYISTGDAESPSPPDRRRTGQDVSDLLSSILRIDVRHSEGGRPYAIPQDNPFRDLPGARAEVWCYGLRNPWRMNFDRATGRLWIADVGWERWESIYCGARGANFGWSIMEGPAPCLPDAKRGPTPIVPPAHSLPHPESASIIAGYVYHGKKLKGYEGRFFYGDWETRRVWANPVRENTLGDREEVARTPYRIVSFAEEADGELLIVDHEGGGIHRLEPNNAGARNVDFPRMLSKTGLFASTPSQTPSSGVIPLTIHAPRWADGATGERWLAIPGMDAIQPYDKERDWPKESIWPKDSVLANTLTFGGRKIETQVLHFDGGGWNAYSYVWNREQTDALLAPSEGSEVDLGGGRKWRVTARAACLTCHNPWPGYSLTLNSAQLEGSFVEWLQKAGVFVKELPKLKPLVDPDDERAPLADRARSYLAVNCAHCHRNGGGGSARIDLRAEIRLEEMRVQGVRPTLGGFDLTDPRLVAGGDPSRSVLLFRVSKLGQGRMPHLGSEVVDEKGVKLLSSWIASLPRVPCETPLRIEDLKALQALFSGDLAAIDRLLASPTGALDLLGAIDSLPPETRQISIRRALELGPGLVRDLFERFEAPADRRQRLGVNIQPDRILSLRGDADRGRRLFASSALQCGKCHRMGEGKETLGPDLSKIGTKCTPDQILESILEPSKVIDPKYTAYIVQTTGGEILNGILISRTDTELVLRNAEKEMRLPADKVQRMMAQNTSLMPEGLLQHLTAQEAADLISFLASLR